MRKKIGRKCGHVERRVICSHYEEKQAIRTVNTKGSGLPHEVVHALCLAEDSPVKDGERQ